MFQTTIRLEPPTIVIRTFLGLSQADMEVRQQPIVERRES